MRYRFLRFPGGKYKALTLSYDDGVIQDKRFAEAIEKYGFKCTFNINSGSLYSGNPKKLPFEELKEHLFDKGHEIAIHGKNHIAPGIPVSSLAIKDALDCRCELEDAFGVIIRGMAYPDSGVTRMSNGNTYDRIKSNLTDLGIVYSRTLGGDNDGFLLPEDFHAWMPTAHHNNTRLLEWAEKFAELSEPAGHAHRYPRLFYLWGHSYEFDNNDNWDRIDAFGEILGNREDIWYATNIEIYEYVEAYNSLICSADGSRIYNPTLKEIFFTADGKDYSIKSGETIKI